MDPIALKLKKNFLFQSLTIEECQTLVSSGHIKKFSPGEFLIQEGSKGTELYLLLQGTVEVIKKEKRGVHKVSSLNEGELVGEMTLIDRFPRSACVKATTECEVIVFSSSTFLSLLKKMRVYTEVLNRISHKLSRRLRAMNELGTKALESELKYAWIQAEMGRFLFFILVTLSTWILFIGVVIKLFHSNSPVLTTIWTTSLLVVLFFVCLLHLKSSIYPLAFYGITLKNWGKALFEGVVFSLPIIAGAAILKWVLIHYVPVFNQFPLLHFTLYDPASPIPPNTQLILLGIYLLFVIFQEFIARGVIQSSIQACLIGKRRVGESIFLASLIFSSFHAHFSILYAVFTFLLGLIWGSFYVRRRSLITPTISHMLVALITLKYLGFQYILTYGWFK